MGMPFFTVGREQDEDWLPNKNPKWSEYGTLCVCQLIKAALRMGGGGGGEEGV